jgi:hypothetical protein
LYPAKIPLQVILEQHSLFLEQYLIPVQSYETDNISRALIVAGCDTLLSIAPREAVCVFYLGRSLTARFSSDGAAKEREARAITAILNSFILYG